MVSNIGWCRVNHISREAKAAKGWARLNLASRGLIRVTDQVLPEQVRGWFNAATTVRITILFLGNEGFAFTCL